MPKAYKSQSARDAQAGNYGDQPYWDDLDRRAQEHHDYFMKKGEPEKARLMMTQRLWECLKGNDGI